MSSISSLSRMVSALMASEQALNTTAHNLTNVNTPGYVRQQVLMNESNYDHIGNAGTHTMSIGMGTDINEIRQVRDIFLDQTFREESGREGFYAAQSQAIDEIETILGETEGESFSKIINDLWNSISELSKHPDGLETRGLFIQSAVIFVEKSNLIMEQLNNYQKDVNTEIYDTVDRINEIGAQIHQLNDTISKAELSGGNANDYRDTRNSLVDELATLVNISYREDADGNMLVNIENVPFVQKGILMEMSTTQAEVMSPMVVPYWPHINEKVFNFDNPVGPDFDNDVGRLKGLVMARGTRQADYTDLQDPVIYEEELKDSVIMLAQAQFDNLVHGIVTMINGVVAPNTTGSPAYLDDAAYGNTAPYGLDGSQGNEIFKRKYFDRYDSGTGEYNEEVSTNGYSLYSAGNLEINAAVLEDYDKIALSANLGYDGDNSVVAEILRKWDENFGSLEPGTTGQSNFIDYYRGFVGNLGNLGFIATQQMENQDLMATQIDNQRNMLMGVSSDEELGNMMKYQHAYNAASRVVTVVDQMIEQVVTSLGLVGR